MKVIQKGNGGAAVIILTVNKHIMRKNNLFTIIFILLLSVVSYPQTTNTKVRLKFNMKKLMELLKLQVQLKI
jgi:hypothetical protein